MNFKIWHKLALLLIATTTITIVIGIGLSQRSFKHGFMDYLQRQEERRINTLVNNLLDAYKGQQSWEFIRGNNQLWFFFLRPRAGRFGPVDGKHMHEPFPADSYPRARHNDDRHDTWEGESERYSDKHSLKRSSKYGPYAKVGVGKRIPKLALLDAQKNYLVGKRKIRGKYHLYPIKYEGQLVGFIKSEQHRGTPDKLDRMFEAQQNQAFVINTIVSIIVSIVVALLASFYFRRRIRVLNQIAGQLTSGNYAERIQVKERDELGQLGADFNTLAHTLEKNQRSQQQWIADISHELRTPVAILKGELEALDDGIRPLDKKAIHSLQQEILRLSQLIEDLYQLSVSDLGALKYSKQEFALEQLWQELDTAFRGRFEKHHIQLNMPIGEKSLSMLGDKQRLFQLFGNLLENSLRYTNSGGRVLFTCEFRDEAIWVSIDDSEPGIPPQQMEQIFDRLFRLDSSRNRSHGGAGLGLAIVKQIVQAHEGEITAQNSPLGGLRIICHFPK